MYRNYDQLGSKEDPERDILDVVELTNSQHRNHILSTNRIVCIDIYADWCGPCKQTAPAYSVLANTYSKPGICSVVKYNYDKLDASQKGKIHGIPVFQFFVNGKQVDEIVGADIPAVEEKLKKLIQNTDRQNVEDLTRPNMASYSSQYSNAAYQGSTFQPSQDINIQGPQHTRNSIRQGRPNNMPSMENNTPYRSDSNIYHKPYQTYQ